MNSTNTNPTYSIRTNLGRGVISLLPLPQIQPVNKFKPAPKRVFFPQKASEEKRNNEYSGRKNKPYAKNGYKQPPVKSLLHPKKNEN